MDDDEKNHFGGEVRKTENIPLDDEEPKKMVPFELERPGTGKSNMTAHGGKEDGKMEDRLFKDLEDEMGDGGMNVGKKW